MIAARRPVARRLHGDEGAVIIEAALALPIIVILVLGILEYGMAFHEGIIIERGLTLVGRTVSNLGASPYADFETLRAVDSQLLALQETSSVKRVIIYKPSSADGSVPQACLDIQPSPGSLSGAGVSGVCNVYSAAQVAQDSPGSGFVVTGSPPSGCGGASWHRFLCPLNGSHRNPKTQTKIGVYIEVEYQPVTGIWPSGQTIERHVVYAIEPPSVGS